MRVTKQYLFIVKFYPSSAEVCDEFSKQSLRQAVWRARGIPDHRILIETHDDLSDSHDVGMATHRLEALRGYFVAESIDAQRIEGQDHTHTDNCPEHITGEFARRADIHLFPRVLSLCREIGDPFLSLDELSTLELARDTVLFPYRHDWKKVEEKCSKDEWKRIVGYESLTKWAFAGARHPLYDEGRRK
jgi:hypothetical protein